MSKDLTMEDVLKRVLDCREYGGSSCNPTIQKIITDAEKLVSRDYNINPSKIKNDFIQFIPRNAEFGYFSADGTYNKY